MGQGQSLYFDDGSQAAFLADMPEVGREPVGDVDGGSGDFPE